MCTASTTLPRTSYLRPLLRILAKGVAQHSSGGHLDRLGNKCIVDAGLDESACTGAAVLAVVSEHCAVAEGDSLVHCGGRES